MAKLMRLCQTYFCLHTHTAFSIETSDDYLVILLSMVPDFQTSPGSGWVSHRPPSRRPGPRRIIHEVSPRRFSSPVSRVREELFPGLQRTKLSYLFPGCPSGSRTRVSANQGGGKIFSKTKTQLLRFLLFCLRVPSVEGGGGADSDTPEGIPSPYQTDRGPGATRPPRRCPPPHRVPPAAPVGDPHCGFRRRRQGGRRPWGPVPPN